MLNEIICGDCIVEMNQLPAEIARLVVADPPYYKVLTGENWDNSWENENDYLSWTLEWIEAAMRVLLPGGLLYCFGQVGKREHVMLHLMSEMTQNYRFHDLIIWDRAVGYDNRCDSFTPAYEMILVLRKDGEVYFDKDAVREPYDANTIEQYKKDKRYKDREAREAHLERGKYATNLWRIPSLKGASHEKVGHPSQKPEALIERILRSSSAIDDLVLDPFSGSGTVAVVADRLQRQWIAIEKSENYVGMSRQRLNENASTPDDVKTTRTDQTVGRGW